MNRGHYLHKFVHQIFLKEKIPSGFSLIVFGVSFRLFPLLPYWKLATTLATTFGTLTLATTFGTLTLATTFGTLATTLDDFFTLDIFF